MGAYEVLVLALAVVAAVSYQAEAGEMCAGCPVKHDPTGFPAEKLNRALSAAQVNEKVVKVLSVSTQVVAGLKYEVVFESASGKTCTATWVEAPWESKFPLGTQISCRAKRSLLGGFQDVDGSELTDMKYMSESSLNEATNGYRRVVVDVVKAQKKVVHGMIYKVKYVVKTTSCKTDEVPNAECLNKETAPKQVCESMFFAAPFLTHGKPHVEVMNTECQAQTELVSFLAVPGKLITPHDEQDFARAKNFAVYTANKGVNSYYYQGFYRLEHYEEKLQAGGKLYNFKFQLRNTDCSKKEGLAALEHCNFAAGNTVDTECSVSVWLWPSSGYMRVESSACANVPERQE